MELKEVLQQAIKILRDNNIEESTSKAKRVFAYLLNVPKEYLIIHDNLEISNENVEKYKDYIQQLISRKPIQYIIGKQEFMGIDFFVNEDVLIPQPDTEILVEKTIEILRNKEKPKVLDLCTGSGAIAIAIEKYIFNTEITAADISEKALKIAKMNDKNKKIKFIESDLFNNIYDKFDIIVSNPPYIKSDKIKELSKEVQNEPLLALDGGKDGLFFYNKIIKQAYNYLNKNGYLCLEIGEDQKNEVVDIIKKSKKYKTIKTYKDFSGNDRVIVAET